MIAVIPARIGSQRIPQKNLCEINNTPLVVMAIEFALGMNLTPIVTSDSANILELAEEHGATPFYSTTHSHTSTSEQVWKEVTKEKSILLEPTSPMRTQQDIEQCLPYDIAATVNRIKTTEGYKYQYNGACYISDFSRPLLLNPHLIETPYRVNIDLPIDLQIAQALVHHKPPPSP
jgi:CMP-N-acetylneuraminic acid synthetase